jgi:hypothetical protein
MTSAGTGSLLSSRDVGAPSLEDSVNVAVFADAGMGGGTVTDGVSCRGPPLQRCSLRYTAWVGVCQAAAMLDLLRGLEA